MRRVGVLGLGLMGGSIARHLSEGGLDVVGYDVAATTCATARQSGLAVFSDIRSLCATDPDVLIVAVPLAAMRSVATELERCLSAAARRHVVVMDIGSVKGSVREVMRAVGLADRFVGAHPMAGTEHVGFGSSDPRLLDGARWAVTVDPDTHLDDVLTVMDLITGQLHGRVSVLTDDVHDESVALISHVPHVLATELMSLVANVDVRDIALGLAAGSFRDGTRVARTDPRRTEAMVTQNAPWVASALRVVVRDLERLVERLETNAAVADFFDRPDPARRVLDRRDDDVRSSEVVSPQCLDLRADRWQGELLDACAAGGVVVGVDVAARTASVASQR